MDSKKVENPKNSSLLGKIILDKCKSKGWTLSRLAKESGVPKPTLHGWTTGRWALNPHQLKCVAACFRISIHELIFGEPDPYGPSDDEYLREIFTGDVRIVLQRIERPERDNQLISQIQKR